MFIIKLLITAFFLYMAYKTHCKLLKSQNFQYQSEKMEASVTAKELIEWKWGIEKPWIHYRFTAPDGQEYTGKSQIRQKLYNSLQTGDNVAILAKKGQYAICCPLENHHDRLSGYIAFIILCVASALALPLFF